MAKSRIGVYAQLPAATVREIGRRAKAGSTKTKKVRIWEVIRDAVSATTPISAKKRASLSVTE